MFSVQFEENPNFFLSPRRPSASWDYPVPASSQRPSSLTTSPPRVPWKWQPTSDFYTFASASPCLGYSYPWSPYSRTASPDRPVYTHTCPPQVSPITLQGVCCYLKSVLLYQFIIHLSPLDCKLHKERDFNPDLLLGPHPACGSVPSTQLGLN